jgi:WD40 repeat protein
MAPISSAMVNASPHGPQTPTSLLFAARTKLSESWTGKRKFKFKFLLNRQGKPVLEFPSNQTPQIDDLAWDKDNDSLAILTKTHVISIWSMGQRKFQDIELASQKDLACYISWSATHPVLVVGTEKGSLVFFNRKSQRKIPCISKHGKAVRHGDWNTEGFLMSASADKMLTVSNHQGDTPFDSFIVKGEPINVRWCPYQDDKQKWVACILNQAKLFMFNPVDG